MDNGFNLEKWVVEWQKAGKDSIEVKLIADQLAENLYQEISRWLGMFKADNPNFSRKTFVNALADRIEQLEKEDG